MSKRGTRAGTYLDAREGPTANTHYSPMRQGRRKFPSLYAGVFGRSEPVFLDLSVYDNLYPLHSRRWA